MLRLAHRNSTFHFYLDPPPWDLSQRVLRPSTTKDRLLWERLCDCSADGSVPHLQAEPQQSSTVPPSWLRLWWPHVLKMSLQCHSLLCWHKHWERRRLKNLQKRQQLWINTQACLISTGTAYGQALLKIWYAAVRWLNKRQTLWKIRTPLWELSTCENAACRTAADGLAPSQQAQNTVWRAASRIGLIGCRGWEADTSW